MGEGLGRRGRRHVDGCVDASQTKGVGLEPNFTRRLQSVSMPTLIQVPSDSLRLRQSFYSNPTATQQQQPLRYICQGSDSRRPRAGR
eukprot:767813-Prymnesium_polylepis.1